MKKTKSLSENLFLLRRSDSWAVTLSDFAKKSSKYRRVFLEFFRSSSSSRLRSHSPRYGIDFRIGSKYLSFKFYGGLFVILLGSLALYLGGIANGPDQDLRFVREIPTQAKADALDRAISDLSQWPLWFHGLASAKGIENQKIIPGSHIELFIDPKKGMRRRFQVQTEVLSYVPGKELHLKVLSDSSGRLNRLFNYLDWKIEVVPQGEGALIRGTATAHTSHWRSRLFGRIATRTLMHQVFYPDLVKFAELDRPKFQNPFFPPQGQ